MHAYLAGNTVALTIPLLDEQGAVVEATAVDYEVIDHLGTVLVARGALSGFTAPADEVIVTVSGANNALLSGEVRGGRTVRLYCTAAGGTVYLTSSYVIEAAEVLVEGDNSFQSLSRAELTAFGLANLPGWVSATRAQKVSAMLEAHRTICQLRYRYVFDNWQDRVEKTFGVADMSLLSPAEFVALPEEFRDALRLAQVVQAEDVLNGNPNATLREEGIMSQTVGESSQMFRPGKPVTLPICREAYKYLAKYVVTSVRVGRA